LSSKLIVAAMVASIFFTIILQYRILKTINQT